MHNPEIQYEHHHHRGIAIFDRRKFKKMTQGRFKPFQPRKNTVNLTSNKLFVCSFLIMLSELVLDKAFWLVRL